MTTRLAVLLVASLAIAACTSPRVDNNATRLVWHGTTFYAAVNGLHPAEADLSEIGAVESVVAAPETPLTGRMAYKLAGVETAEAVAMALADGGYMLFKAQPGAPVSAGLCRYIAHLPGSGC